MDASPSPNELRALRLRAQQLHARPTPGSADPAQLVREVFGVQAQDAFAAELSIWVRIPGLTGSDLRRALVTDRSIVRTWTLRGTLHLAAADDLGWLLPLLGPLFIRQTQARYDELGLTEEVWSQALKVIGEALEAQGRLTREELAGHLSRRGLPAEGQIVPHILRRAAADGVVCYGPDKDGKPAYVLLSAWAEIGGAIERGAALDRLIQRYLAAFAPASAEDFAAWAGLNLTEARAGFEAARSELLELEADGQPLWFPASRAEWLEEMPEAPSGVRLLPGFDTYLLGYRSRDLTVPERFAKAVHPGGGIIRPTLLADGIAAGIWRRSRSGGGMTITLVPFERLDKRTTQAIEAEVEDLGRFLVLDTRLVIDSPLA